MPSKYLWLRLWLFAETINEKKKNPCNLVDNIRQQPTCTVCTTDFVVPIRILPGTSSYCFLQVQKMSFMKSSWNMLMKISSAFKTSRLKMKIQTRTKRLRSVHANLPKSQVWRSSKRLVNRIGTKFYRTLTESSRVDKNQTRTQTTVQ